MTRRQRPDRVRRAFLLAACLEVAWLLALLWMAVRPVAPGVAPGNDPAVAAPRPRRTAGARAVGMCA